MHFLENSRFVLNAYFYRELRFVAILLSRLRFLPKNTGVDSEFLRKKLTVEVSGLNIPMNTFWEGLILLCPTKNRPKKKNYQRRGLPSSVEIDSSKGCQQLVFERHSVSYFLFGTFCMSIVQLYKLH